MSFLLKTDKHETIPADLRQTFENKFTLSVGRNEIVKMKNTDVIKDRDLDVAKFLFQMTFATARQIHMALADKSSSGNIQARLEKLVRYRILNKFMLSSFEEEKVHPEAQEFYCLDLGGRYLLAHYSNQDTTDWVSTVNMKSSELISKTLAVTEFYVQLKRSIPEKIISFKAEPELRMGKKNIVPSFELTLDVGGLPKCFLGEVVREYDFPSQFRDKAAKLESILVTRAWKKYYYQSDTPPVLFVLCDGDRTAFDAGKLIQETTEMRSYRLTTDERMSTIPLYELGAFLRYEAEEPDEKKLREIKAVTFRP
ncbi:MULTISPECIES: replication-relaxation family protein [unclassified Psychrobacillus]|uniref:replication-relaxation family protein n=1 Tax=unclassified Psychrobacillus TaxID=2636677 RepID=UPI0030FB1C5D